MGTARPAHGSDPGCRQRAARATARPSSWPCSSCLHLLGGAAFAVCVGVALARSDQLRALRLVLLRDRSDQAESGAQELGSAHRSLHERADLCLLGGGQLLQREGGRPHGAFVEVRLVAEAERRVPRVELLRALEEADDLAVLGIRRHPVPGFRREVWRAGLDDLMEPLGQGAIRFLHLGDLREHVALPIRLLRLGLKLSGALLHRVSFLVRESLGLLCAHRSLLCRLSHVLLRPARKVYLRPRTLTSRYLIGLVTCFATHDEALSRQPRASGTGAMHLSGYGLPRMQLLILQCHLTQSRSAASIRRLLEYPICGIRGSS